EVIHEENLRPHYALTLRDWCANLVDHWDEAVEEVGEPKARLWGLYMGACQYGFEHNKIQLHQILAVKLGERQTWDIALRPWWRAGARAARPDPAPGSGQVEREQDVAGRGGRATGRLLREPDLRGVGDALHPRRGGRADVTGFHRARGDRVVVRAHQP